MQVHNLQFPIIQSLISKNLNARVEDNYDPAALKSQFNHPVEFQPCRHTAIVGCYLIEGYVPTADVERLLAKKPDICGMAVPDMPAGSPGMEMEGVAPHPFNVIAFDAIDNVEVFANCKQRDPKRAS